MAALALAACNTTPRTQVMVVVTADEQVRAATTQLMVEVSGGPAPDALEEAATYERAVESWPQRIPIVPRGNDASRAFGVLVTAQMDDTSVVARAVSGFVAGETRVLHIHLSASCAGMECGPTQPRLRADSRRVSSD